MAGFSPVMNSISRLSSGFVGFEVCLPAHNTGLRPGEGRQDQLASGFIAGWR